MNNSNVKKVFIPKEKQDHIRRFFESNASHRNILPASPSIEFDSTFSRLLMEKRKKQQNESTLNEKILDHTNSVNKSEAHLVEPTQESCHKETHPTKRHASLMENSMKIIGNTSTGLDGDDDSFLEMEFQCHFEEQRQRILEAEANNTLLSDIEPPPELWEDSLIAQAPIFQHLRNDDDLIQLSPMRMVGVMRQSTIVEETSSQCNSTDESSRNSTNKTNPENSIKSKSSSSTIYLSSGENSMIEKISPLKLVNKTPSKEYDMLTPGESKKKRETMMFTKRKYKFFKDENDQSNLSIDSPKTPATNTNDLISMEQSPLVAYETPTRNQFNDTFEAVEFFMEKGKQLLEQTPQAKSGVNRTLLETPMFSCKRTRILSEMAAAVMQPIPKRGPLIDLYSSPDSTACPNVRK